jgi:hypothetical protein
VTFPEMVIKSFDVVKDAKLKLQEEDTFSLVVFLVNQI